MTARTLVAIVALLLIATSVWSAIQATAWGNQPQTATAQQLAEAERCAGFHVRLPSTLPPGMQLVRVTHERSGCSPCGIDLTYHDSRGREIILFERDQVDSWVADSTPPNYRTNEVTVGEVRPVSWLYDDIRTYHERIVGWTDGRMSYMLSTTDDFSIDQLEQIAASISSS